MNVAFSIDPGDPEQIFINNNSGTNTFTIGFRIDQHQSQSGNGCFTPPPQNQNAFPMTDNSGVASPTDSWINAIDCGVFGCPPAGARSSPSGALHAQRRLDAPGHVDQFHLRRPDQVPAATAASASISPGRVPQHQRLSAGRVHSASRRPDPRGRCCLTNGNCLFITEDSCDLIGGAWRGPTSMRRLAVPDRCCVSARWHVCRGHGSWKLRHWAGRSSASGQPARTPTVRNRPRVLHHEPTVSSFQKNCNLIPDAVWLGMGTICDGDGTHHPRRHVHPARPCIADTNGDGMLSPADGTGRGFQRAAPECDQNTDGMFSRGLLRVGHNYNAGC